MNDVFFFPPLSSRRIRAKVRKITRAELFYAPEMDIAAKGGDADAVAKTPQRTLSNTNEELTGRGSLGAGGPVGK